MENDHYNEALVNAVKKLSEFHETIYLSVFHLAMVGELKDWNDSVEIGETYEFSQEIFESFADTNKGAIMLTQLYKNVNLRNELAKNAFSN